MKAKLEQELLFELSRMECPKYLGVLIIPKIHHTEVVTFLKERGGKLCHQFGDITMPLGGRVIIRDEGGKKDPEWNYAGLEILSVLLDKNVIDPEYHPNNLRDPIRFILYLNSRLRSESKHHTRLVLF